MLNRHGLAKLFSIRETYYGLQYTLESVFLVMEDEERLNPLYKRVYRVIAERHGISVHCVRRDIKTVIEVWWREGNRDVLETLRPNETKPPKNKEFISLLVAYLERRAQTQADRSRVRRKRSQSPDAVQG